MKTRFKIFAVLAGIHLVLVAASAAHLQIVTPEDPIGRGVLAYESFSGADNTFAFFAPSVAPQFRATFTLTDAGGKSWEEAPEQGATREANLRFDSVTNMFSYPHLSRRIAASMAASLFGRRSDAAECEVFVELQDTPTMEAYRDGVRPEWQPVYLRSFYRDTQAPVASAATETADSDDNS